MTNEELERHIQFIVNQQAIFFSDIEALKERQAAFSAAFSSSMEELKERQAETQKHLNYITKLVGVIGDQTLSNSEAIKQNSVAINQLTVTVNGLARMMGQHIGDANGHVQLEAEE